MLVEHPGAVRDVGMCCLGWLFHLAVTPAVRASTRGDAPAPAPAGFPSTADLLVSNRCLRGGGITPLTQCTT